MGNDGEIRINTRMDTSGVTKDAKNLKATLTNTFASMRDVMQGPIAAGKMLIDVMQAIGKATVGNASKIEDMVAAFTPLTGGAENAKEMIAALNREAATTPFELEGIGSVAKQLLPVLGNNVKAVTQTFRMLGDTAGGNVNKLDSITRGYTKTLMKGKADMESLNMITEAGVPIIDQLAKSMGKSKEEIYKMSEQGKLSADMVTEAFKYMTKEGGIFYNGMEVASQTLSGKLSTLSDNLKQLGAAIGEGLLPLTKGIVDKISELSKELVDFLVQTNKVKEALKAEKDGNKTLEQRLTLLDEQKKKLDKIIRAETIKNEEGYTSITMAGQKAQAELSALQVQISGLKKAQSEQQKALKAKEEADKKAVDSEKKKADEIIAQQGRVSLSAGLSNPDMQSNKFLSLPGLELPKQNINSVLMDSYNTALKVAEDAGNGVAKSFADGMAEKMYAISSTAKMIFTNIAAIAIRGVATVKNIITGGFGLISSLAKFTPEEMLKSLDEFLIGLNDFIDNDLPKLSVFFDKGVILVEEFLAGMESKKDTISLWATNAINSISSAIQNKLPEISALGTALVSVMLSNIGNETEIISKALVTLIQAIGGALAVLTPQVVDIGLQLLSYTMQGLASDSEKITEGVSIFLGKIIKSLQENAPEIIVASITIVAAFINGVLAQTGPLTLLASDLIIAMVKGIVENAPALLAALIVAFTELSVWLAVTFPLQMIALIDDMFAKLITSIKNGTFFTNLGAWFESMFGDLVDVFVRQGGEILTAFESIGKSISSIFSDGQTIGNKFITDLVNGIAQIGPQINIVIQKMRTFISEKFSDGYNQGYGFINSLLAGLKSIGTQIDNIFINMREEIKKAFKGGSKIGSDFIDGILIGFESIGTDIDDIFTGIKTSIENILSDGFSIGEDFMKSLWKGMKDTFKDLAKGAGKFGDEVEKVLGFAGGTNYAPGGLAIVGEKGPELVNLPRGSKVFTNQETVQMMQPSMPGISQAYGMATGGGSAPIYVNLRMDGLVNVDGATIANVVFQKLDYLVGRNYGR